MNVTYESHRGRQTPREPSARRKNNGCKMCCGVGFMVLGVVCLLGGVIPIATGDSFVLGMCLGAGGVVAIIVGFCVLGCCTGVCQPAPSNVPPRPHQPYSFQQHQPFVVQQGDILHPATTITYDPQAQPPLASDYYHAGLQPTAPSWQNQSYERQRSPPTNPKYEQPPVQTVNEASPPSYDEVMDS